MHEKNNEARHDGAAHRSSSEPTSPTRYFSTNARQIQPANPYSGNRTEVVAPVKALHQHSIARCLNAEWFILEHRAVLRAQIFRGGLCWRRRVVEASSLVRPSASFRPYH